MEDYEAACSSRILDIEVLMAAVPPRTTAVVHLGGVAIECRLKALIINYHQIKSWGELSARTGDPRYRQPILRTSHALITAVKLMSVLYKKALADHHFIVHLNAINYPIGATLSDFIALRYSPHGLSAATMTDWQNSLKYVLGWLKKNEKLL